MRQSLSVLGLPDSIRACLFDLDGVLTQTARVHAAAWQATFDAYLTERARRGGGQFAPFDPVADSARYLDGRLRADGTRAFLASRGISLPEGDAHDPPDAETINGLSNRKNQAFLEQLQRDGVQTYPGSMRYLEAVRAAGLSRALVSASANARQVLAAAGSELEDAFDAIVDGVVAGREHLRGKPAPDTYLAGARLLHVEPSAAAVFEDALAGVEAGHAGGFGYVVGVDRLGQRAALLQSGASRVVDDLAELLDQA